MTEPHDYYVNARNIAVDILRKETTRTSELIAQVAAKAVQAATIFAPNETIDVEGLTAELRHLFSVVVDQATVLDDHDPKGHKPWLSAKRGSIQWRFWNRYMTYLERDFGMPPTVVNNLHELTDMVLERLEDPQRDGPWDRRGMVVGSVQSGKTANYTGLICKAVDAGYKLVVILAGLHSNLRSQTQLRIDEGVLGFDTQKSRRLDNNSQLIGVGKLPGDRLYVHAATNSSEDGDFSKPAAERFGVMLGSDPVVLVVKKHSSVLANLLQWALAVAGTDDPASGRRVVKDVPLLLIDDEADNASVNTKDRRNKKAGGKGEDTVSAINGRIREILAAFEKCTYVGYTATPFANIFINPEAQTQKHQDDIFPRSFIINVKPPSNYVGPATVFGLDGDPDADIAPKDGLPIIKEISDFEPAFPPKHKADFVPSELPASLKRAIRCFILTCAARSARGQGKKHNSMLVHVTRFVEVQGHVARLVRDELLSLQRRIEFGDGNRKPTLREELRTLWEQEFEPVTKAIGDNSGEPVAWSQVDAALHAAASKITVLTINGFAKEALDYKEHESTGRNVIAVGGDKLSRGLTLEGLSISYFLRTSKMYDTLMQMGRWFGYRTGYLDLCRLFTTTQLVTWYRHIALAEAELRREFDYMVAAGLSPEKYGLRVRTHPGGMIVTAINKMCHSQELELSWAGVLVQTTQLPKDEKRIKANLRATEQFIGKLSRQKQEKDRETVSWEDVTAEDVASFVEAMQLPPESARAGGKQLATFIRKQTAKEGPELTNWTVVLVSNAQADRDKHRVIGGYTIGLIERTPESQRSDSFALRKANILNPPDQARDLAGIKATEEVLAAVAPKLSRKDDLQAVGPLAGKTLKDLAVALTRLRVKAGAIKGKEDTDVPNGRVIREVRPKTHGLLLIYPLQPPREIPGSSGTPSESTGLDPAGDPIIGVALSFPTSDTVLGVEYRVNRVWDSEMQEDAAYED